MAAKLPQDLHQASSLFDALAEHRAHDLAAAWNEAYERGPQWRKYLRDALSHLDPLGRDRLLYAIGKTRSIVSGLDIEFRDAPPRYDFSRGTVAIAGPRGEQPRGYAVSREALDDWFSPQGKGPEAYVRASGTIAQRSKLSREIYVNEPVPADGAILIKTADVPRLRMRIKSMARQRKSTS